MCRERHVLDKRGKIDGMETTSVYVAYGDANGTMLSPFSIKYSSKYLKIKSPKWTRYINNIFLDIRYGLGRAHAMVYSFVEPLDQEDFSNNCTALILGAFVHYLLQRNTVFCYSHRIGNFHTKCYPIHP